MQKIDNLKREQVDSILSDIFGPRFKAYRDKWYKVETEKGAYCPDYPLHLDLEITGKCNLMCKMCSRSFYAKELTNNGLDYKELKKIFDESENRSYGVMIGYNDEPLVDKKKLIWTIEYARRKNFLDVFLSTNAVDLDQHIIEQLLKLEVTSLTVSIDSVNPHTYEAIRGKDAYQQVMDNINLFLKMREEKQSRIPTLRLNFVEMGENYLEKQQFLDYWKDKADNIVIQGMVDINLKKEDLSSEELGLLYNAKNVCWQPFRRLSISGEGDIYPCCHFIPIIRKQSLGNIKTNTLEEVWNSENMNRIRNVLKSGRFYEIPFCLECAISTSRQR